MNKKGFTLIELLAVIVILAVIALIVTPIVTGIIGDAKTSANARSVEGHIKDVEYAMVTGGFNGGNLDVSQFNTSAAEGDALNATLASAIPSTDTIRCAKYIIKEGVISKATDCTQTSWNGQKFNFESGKGATVVGS